MARRKDREPIQQAYPVIIGPHPLYKEVPPVTVVSFEPAFPTSVRTGLDQPMPPALRSFESVFPVLVYSPKAQGASVVEIGPFDYKDLQ